MTAAIELIATHERNRQMVDMGAYKSGSNEVIDRAIRLYPGVRAVLRQSVLESSTRTAAMALLRAALSEEAQ
jgi:flagellum-specific ATP synthase